MRSDHSAIVVPKVMTKVSPKFKAVLEDLPQLSPASDLG